MKFQSSDSFTSAHSFQVNWMQKHCILLMWCHVNGTTKGRFRHCSSYLGLCWCRNVYCCSTFAILLSETATVCCLLVCVDGNQSGNVLGVVNSCDFSFYFVKWTSWLANRLGRLRCVCEASA